MDEAPVHLWHKETIHKMPNTVDSTQPSIAGEGEGEVKGDAMEEHVMADLLVGEEKDLMRMIPRISQGGLYKHHRLAEDEAGSPLLTPNPPLPNGSYAHGEANPVM